MTTIMCVAQPTNESADASPMVGFDLLDAPQYGDLLNCMHCGLCLPQCPTFALTGRERSSPRGRIQLMRGVADGALEISEVFSQEIYFCLGCLACMTACPAGVQYGSMLEAARTQIETSRFRRNEPAYRRFGRLVRGCVRRLPFAMFERLPLFRLAGRALYLYERTGLRRLLHRLGLPPGQLGQMEQLLPAVPARLSSETLPEVAEPVGAVKHRVGLLLGCAMDVMCSPENEATVRVLQRNGCQVVTPRDAGCCGALHAHAGELAKARQMAKLVIAAFERAEVDAIVMNSAGCGAAMKDYAHWLHDDPKWGERARAFSAKVLDLTEWFDRHGLDTAGMKPLGKVVTYHDACHLHHAQGVIFEPRRVLAKVPGVHYVELNEANWCCGSAGVYNVTHFAESVQLLDRKMANIAATGADVVVTSNPGCLLQLRYGIKRHSLKMEAWHMAEYLDRAYGGG
ncbi:MAG: (Fe-S)-binding protein [Armatimonadetes bacterium]|nr:(Fe-S)-binding protein [Armatimonadota bacterium]